MEENENRRSTFREISRKEMLEVLEKSALKHKQGVYHLPLFDVSTDDRGIAIIPNECNGIIAIAWDSLMSIRHNPVEGNSPGTLTFTMPYGVVTIVLEENRHES